MEKDVHHSYLYTLCAFILCFMFVGSIARAEEPFPVFLNMSSIDEYQMRGYVQVYQNQLDMSSSALLRVFPGNMGMQTVVPGEWIAINLVQISAIYPCKNYQEQHRIQVGEGVLSQAVIVTPRLTVEGSTTVCRLDIAAADEN